MDQNLAWLTQKTEHPKSNNENLTFPTHTVNMIQLWSNKKVAIPPHFYINSPPLQVYPPFLAKHFVPPPPPKWFNFREVLPPLWGSNHGSILKNMLILKKEQMLFLRKRVPGFWEIHYQLFNVNVSLTSRCIKYQFWNDLWLELWKIRYTLGGNNIMHPFSSICQC